MKTFVLVWVVFLFLSGCASTMTLQPIAAADQMSIYVDGTQSLISKGRSVVVVRPKHNTYTTKQRLTFLVTMRNGTDDPVVFSTENISAFAEGLPLKVFSYDELVAEVHRRRKQEAVAEAIAGIGRSISAARASNQYMYGNYYSAGGFSGTYSGLIYNEAVAAQLQAQAQEQTRRNIEAIDLSARLDLSYLSRAILKKETVFPNMWHGGYVTIQQPHTPDNATSIILKVQVADEEHVFKFVQSKVK